MSEPSTRPPTQADTWVSPLAAYSDGNLFPYWNLKSDGLTPYITALKRTFSGLNPFAVQQVPTSERAAVGVMYGSKFYKNEVFYSLFSPIPTQLPSAINIHPIMIPSTTRDSRNNPIPTTILAKTPQSAQCR